MSFTSSKVSIFGVSFLPSALSFALMTNSSFSNPFASITTRFSFSVNPSVDKSKYSSTALLSFDSLYDLV